MRSQSISPAQGGETVELMINKRYSDWKIRKFSKNLKPPNLGPRPVVPNYIQITNFITMLEKSFNTKQSVYSDSRSNLIIKIEFPDQVTWTKHSLDFRKYFVLITRTASKHSQHPIDTFKILLAERRAKNIKTIKVYTWSHLQLKLCAYFIL